MNTSDNIFTPGSHISCIYRTDEELLSFSIPFFIDGLKKQNKCIYILGDESPEEIISAFNNYGFNLSPYLATNDFIFTPGSDIYFNNGDFNVNNITSNFVAAESNAIKQNYSALRVLGSATWIIKDKLIIPSLVKYEKVVNDFIESSYIIAACTYKESLFKDKMLIDTIYNHPLVYLYDRLINNTYFGSSLEKDNMNLSDVTYEEITNTLKSLQ